MKYVSFVALSLLLFASTPVCGQDTTMNWPQWRGAHLDSISHQSDLVVEFDKNKNMLWRFEMPGPGGASPVVWNQDVFVTSVNSSDDSLELICLDTDGGEQWRRTLSGQNRNVRMDRANSASPSPVTDGEHVWANTAAGFLECFDMKGTPVWTVDLQERYGKFNIQFGMSSTPILDDGRIYLQMIHGNMRDRDSTSKGIVAAVDANTGDEIWTHERLTDGVSENKHSYASPTIMRTGKLEQLITHGADYVMGHSLDDGAEIWRCGGLNPRGASYNNYLRFVATPTFHDGRLIVPSAKGGPVFCLKPGLTGDVTGDEDALRWTLPKGTPDVASPVSGNGLIFLARENGVMLCLEAINGQEVYQKRVFAGGHRSTPVMADGKLYLVARDGVVVVMSADRQGTILSENELGEEAKASPAIAAGRIYIRTTEALYCFGSE